MSRAFTKEDDAGDGLPEKPVPAGPNYVTPRGLDLLKTAAREHAARRKETAAKGGELGPIDRDLRYLEARINGATLVPRGKGSEARFGARVTLEDEEGRRTTFQIVGEDEARSDPNALIAWSAPLVQGLLGAKSGESVTWQGANGPSRHIVKVVEY